MQEVREAPEEILGLSFYKQPGHMDKAILSPTLLYFQLGIENMF